ncbi:MAG: PLP-dependent aminotransferase family protein [Clostridia bacterium]|nr:PLP-dependent aminotransferase family protein [Clostridia bacterium]
MKQYLDCTSNKAAYLQLYEHLRRDITAGIYTYGTKLPSKRLLAEENGVSVITAQHAYELLAEEGYIEARQRSGYYVSYREKDLLAVAPSGKTVHPTTHSVKTPFPYSVLAKTMRRVLTEYGESILIKSPNHGCAELRAAIAAYLARSNGITVRPEQIIIGSGAEYLYSLLAQLLGDQHTFALEDPSYDKIRRVYSAHKVQYDLLKLGPDGIRTAELERTEASVLHVTPFNSFPGGITADASKRSEYLLWAEKREGYLIEDNYESELTVSRKHDDPLFLLSGGKRVLYLNTFSQTIAPSLRVGYLLLPEALLPAFEQKLGFYSCTVPVFEQYVLTELLNSGDFERHVNRVRRSKRKNLVI